MQELLIIRIEFRSQPTRLKQGQIMKTYLICSGGLDSVSLAYILAERGDLHGILSFNYAQRHKKELFFAKLCADKLGVPFDLIDISSIGQAMSNTALTGDISVPDGHYAEESMKITVVPNRNAIFLSIAFGLASAKGANQVALAVHGGDHFIYPDCRPDFINSFAIMENYSLEGSVGLYAPFVQKTKADIVSLGNEVNTPFIETWSCYKGMELHCGRCGTCVERREAFYCAGVEDPTLYLDDNFWKTQIELGH